jgi:hypothetical protein
MLEQTRPKSKRRDEGNKFNAVIAKRGSFLPTNKRMPNQLGATK